MSIVEKAALGLSAIWCAEALGLLAWAALDAVRARRAGEEDDDAEG